MGYRQSAWCDIYVTADENRLALDEGLDSR